MKFQQLKTLVVSIIILSFIIIIKAETKSVLIGKDIVLFEPENFDSHSHLPSFVLLNEPNEIGAMPETWSTKVQFTEAFDKSIAYINVDKNTDLYGTGEVTGSLLRNGTTRKLWNIDNYRYKINRGNNLYQSHPWVLGVRENGTAFGVLADNTWKQEIFLGDGITFTSDSKPFRVIVIERETPQDVMKALGDLIGTMSLPPLWSLGFQQCRHTYYPDSRVEEIADTMRIKKIPCDVIWMDIIYMDEYRVFTFSPEHFPNPKETNDYLHKKGFKSVWMIDPGVKNEKGYFVFDSGTEKDVWVKTKDNKNFIGKVWPGDCVFPDFTQQKTINWWAGLYKDFMKIGVDGVWNDMNEPAVFDGPGGTMAIDNVHQGSEILPKNSHLRYHNLYGMMMVKASRKGIQEANPTKRPFVLTRSNFLGGHRYAATWTGDNTSTWEHLKMSIPMSLNLSLSGQPFNGPDIGGFTGNATPDLYGHWIALGAFFPFCRVHSDFRSKNREPWAFGQEIENVSRIALNRRYRLLPYLYTLFHESSVNGMPVMRPVFFADVKDTRLRTEDEIFMLGNDLIIIPKWAVEPELPKGNWRTINLVGEDSENDQYQPDLKIRPGAIIPLSNIIQNTGEYSLTDLDLYVSLDEKGKARGTLYYDEGDGYDYKNSQYSLTTFTAEQKGNKVIIKVSDKEGKYNPKTKNLIVHLITDNGIIEGQGKLSKPIRIKISKQ